MAITTRTQFQIYHQQFYIGMDERIAQEVAVFNDASSNAIRLVDRRHRGDYEQQAFFKRVSGAVKRRNPTSTSALTPDTLDTAESAAVKLKRNWGPVQVTRDAWRSVQMDPGVMSVRLGRQVADDVLGGYLNDGLTVATKAINNIAALKHDATAGTIDFAALNKGLSKFGDRSGDIRTFVVHSKVWHDLVSVQLAASTELMGIGSFAAQQGNVPALARRVIVTDSSALVVAGTPVTYYTLGLVEDAIEVIESEERSVEQDQTILTENSTDIFKVEYAFSLRLKGYTWDIANGGANPDASTLATASNWDKVSSDNKDTAGIIIQSQ